MPRHLSQMPFMGHLLHFFIKQIEHPVLLNCLNQFKSQPHWNILSVERENNLTTSATLIHPPDLALHILQWTGNDSNSITFFICLGKAQQPIVLENPPDEPFIFTLQLPYPVVHR